MPRIRDWSRSFNIFLFARWILGCHVRERGWFRLKIYLDVKQLLRPRSLQVISKCFSLTSRGEFVRRKGRITKELLFFFNEGRWEARLGGEKLEEERSFDDRIEWPRGERRRKGEIYVTNFGKEINNVNPSAGFLFGRPVLGLNFNYLHNLISSSATIHG